MLFTYPPDSNHVKSLGRTLFQDGFLWCAHSGTGAEFRLTGTKLFLSLLADSVALTQQDKTSSLQETCSDETASSQASVNYCRIAVYVSGKRVFCGCLTSQLTTLSVLDSTQPQSVTVRIVKLSESAMSTFAIQKIETDASELVPTLERPVLIEFIGDSITCGYGVDAKDETEHFTTATEDVTKTYAYQTAQALSADYSMVCFSGYGILSGFTAEGIKNEKETLPQHYQKFGFSYASLCGKNPSDYLWTPDGRKPQVIVINLGTNDASYCRDETEKQSLFIKAYTDFLKEVRGCHPKAFILCTLGILDQRLISAVSKAIKDYQDSTKDHNLSFMPFELQSSKDGYGADWHPSALTQTKAARKLTRHLQELLLPNRPLIALTFDDGPNTTTTPHVLACLERYQIPATFFAVGSQITEETSDILRRACQIGCEIANHSLTHRAMPELEEAVQYNEIEETSSRIYAAAGVRPRFFRPPYIAVNDKMHEVIQLPFICGYGAKDWEESVSAKERAERILSQAADGAILLLHDSSGNDKTVLALQQIIPALLERGYEFVTVSDLFQKKQVDPENYRGTIFSVVTGEKNKPE